MHVWLTTTEAAKYLGYCRHTILRFAQTGELRGYRRPGSARSRWRFRLADLNAFALRGGVAAQDEGATQ